LKNNQIYVPKNNREWFLNYLFTDPDFIKEKDKIINDIKALVGEEAFGIMLLVSDKQTFADQLKELSKYPTAGLVGALHPNQPKLQYDPDSQATKILKRIDAMADNFDVTVATVEQGVRYTPIIPGLALKAVPLVNIEGNQVVIRLNGTMKMSDIKSAYGHISELQKELPDYKTRNRSKVRPDLIYAIYKQRLKKVPFSKIYEMYESKHLPGYSGTIAITGPDSLERQYNKYKPAI
jgi:hypothetical protein